MTRVSGWVGRARRFPVLVPVLVAVPLVLLPPVAVTEEDSMLVSAAASTGEVERAPAVSPAVRRAAAAKFVAWESRVDRSAPRPLGRAEVAEGIRLLGETVEAESGASLGSALSEVLLSMQWHAQQLVDRPDNPALGAYEDAGHAHAAFMHAARLVGALPDVPSGATGELTRAATAVDARPLPAQEAEVRAFFRRAAAALTASTSP